jgi:hypothetical protein
MNDIPPINGTGPLFPPVGNRGSLALAPSATPDTGDQLELSDVAQILGRLPSSTPSRAERISQIRQAIQDGTYDTSNKMDKTLDRLMDVLGLH